jgi:hypothetical protein
MTKGAYDGSLYNKLFPTELSEGFNRQNIAKATVGSSTPNRSTLPFDYPQGEIPIITPPHEERPNLSKPVSGEKREKDKSTQENLAPTKLFSPRIYSTTKDFTVNESRSWGILFIGFFGLILCTVLTLSIHLNHALAKSIDFTFLNGDNSLKVPPPGIYAGRATFSYAHERATLSGEVINDTFENFSEVTVEALLYDDKGTLLARGFAKASTVREDNENSALKGKDTARYTINFGEVAAKLSNAATFSVRVFTVR